MRVVKKQEENGVNGINKTVLAFNEKYRNSDKKNWIRLPNRRTGRRRKMKRINSVSHKGTGGVR